MPEQIQYKFKSYPKVNIFLKVIGYKNNMHQILSRILKVKTLYDEIIFIPHNKKYFKLEGEFGCKNYNNTITKAYKLLLEHYPKRNLIDFFNNYKVRVIKKIPIFAGLGGASSNAAVFLMAVNELANLNLSQASLMQLGANVGADVNFFLSGCEAANVSGFGEIIQPFDEKLLKLEIQNPKINSMTAAVFAKFRADFSHTILNNQKLARELLNQNSQEILSNYNKVQLNDLYQAALKIYPELSNYASDDNFFSGSGSSFFRLNAA